MPSDLVNTLYYCYRSSFSSFSSTRKTPANNGNNAFFHFRVDVFYFSLSPSSFLPLPSYNIKCIYPPVPSIPCTVLSPISSLRAPRSFRFLHIHSFSSPLSPFPEVHTPELSCLNPTLSYASLEQTYYRNASAYRPIKFSNCTRSIHSKSISPISFFYRHRQCMWLCSLFGPPTHQFRVAVSFCPF